MLARLRAKGRFGLYLGLIALLALLCGIAVWSVARTGAYLTDEGDWQYLGGDYRIGTIDYTVTVNDQQLMGLAPGTAEATTYQLVVPMVAGVRMYDPTVTAALRTAEFNEGATLMRVRVINRSDSMVEVHAAFTLQEETGNSSPLRVLPLPVDLDAVSAARLDYRKYVTDTLRLTDPNDFTAANAEPAALTALDTAYAAYHDGHPMSLDAGIIPGSIGADPTAANVTVVDGKPYYFKDVFLLLWTEYGTGEYNVESTPSAPIRQGQFLATFTVGQVD